MGEEEKKEKKLRERKEGIKRKGGIKWDKNYCFPNDKNYFDLLSKEICIN